MRHCLCTNMSDWQIKFINGHTIFSRYTVGCSPDPSADPSTGQFPLNDQSLLGLTLYETGPDKTGTYMDMNRLHKIHLFILYIVSISFSVCAIHNM